MTDLLIRNVDPATVRRIEAQARRKGLAREEYLRRELDALSGNAERAPLTREDLVRSLAAMADLNDPSVMDRAWS